MDELVEDLDGIPDERLRLVFTCCHPALAPEAQVALTLRLVCGLSTPEIARAFLVQEATMAARITRAKRKIRVANIPYRVPEGDELPPRLEQVLSVVHLVFTTGHSAPSGEHLTRPDLAERGVELARMLRALLPADPEVAGLLALVLLTDARRPLASMRPVASCCSRTRTARGGIAPPSPRGWRSSRRRCGRARPAGSR